MKDFDFLKSDSNGQGCTALTCYSVDVDYKHHPDNKELIIDYLKKETIANIALLLEDKTCIKLICQMEDSELGRVIDDRPLVKAIVEHAKTEFLTDVLTREVKI